MAAGKEFIAEDPVHVVVASEQKAIHNERGQLIHPKRRRVFAKFVRGAAPVYAQQLALQSFSFRKIHQGIAPERWFGYYNTKEAQQQFDWTDEEHDLIVNKLTEAGYIEVKPVKLAPPWPAYDTIKVHGQRKIEHVVEKIVAKVAEDGYDPAKVAAYERQAANRPEVLAALETANDEEPEPLIVA